MSVMLLSVRFLNLRLQIQRLSSTSKPKAHASIDFSLVQLIDYDLWAFVWTLYIAISGHSAFRHLFWCSRLGDSLEDQFLRLLLPQQLLPLIIQPPHCLTQTHLGLAQTWWMHHLPSSKHCSSNISCNRDTKSCSFLLTSSSSNFLLNNSLGSLLCRDWGRYNNLCSSVAAVCIFSMVYQWISSHVLHAYFTTCRSWNWLDVLFLSETGSLHFLLDTVQIPSDKIFAHFSPFWSIRCILHF